MDEKTLARAKAVCKNSAPWPSPKKEFTVPELKARIAELRVEVDKAQLKLAAIRELTKPLPVDALTETPLAVLVERFRQIRAIVEGTDE